ncbi:MAG: hypothetical protein A49_28000 [Methyloceanibacter sp.]|nr:MAG: hypothetical protein A49_28000 [Methyloceanibacter sp.]
MALLIVGIVVFLGLHLLPTRRSTRERLVARFGENGYKALFSVASILAFVLLVYGFATAPIVQIWVPPIWMRHLAMLLMIPAFIFLVAAYLPGRIKTVVKHPMLTPSRLGRWRICWPMATSRASCCSVRSLPMRSTTGSRSSTASPPK